jgi:predicted dehydrogenase
MKGLVVGGGSIGKRHLQNLRVLGIRELGLVEPSRERREALVRECTDVVPFDDLGKGLAWAPTFVIVGTPTHLHVAQACEVVRCGCDVLVEKPLSHERDGLAELASAVQRRKLVSLVGCNMRFHPGPAKIKELLDRNVLGKLLFARIWVGSYLPSWRPGSDYRSNYAAHEETGGGCILDWVHEIDLARWYFGEVQEVFCASGHMSSLEISTEDVAALICRHESGTLCEMHLDYVQRIYERGCQIVGEAGSILWDFSREQVRWYDAASEGWTNFDQPHAWQLNQMYVDEMRHFLECVQERKQTALPIPEAIKVMDIIFAAKLSAREGRMVPTRWEVPA